MLCSLTQQGHPRLRFDGDVVGDDETAESLGLEEDDLVDLEM